MNNAETELMKYLQNNAAKFILYFINSKNQLFIILN